MWVRLRVRVWSLVSEGISVTLSGPVYFEKQLNTKTFRLFEKNLFLRSLFKSEHQQAFKLWYTLKQLGLHSGTSQSGQ